MLRVLGVIGFIAFFIALSPPVFNGLGAYFQHMEKAVEDRAPLSYALLAAPLVLGAILTMWPSPDRPGARRARH